MKRSADSLQDEESPFKRVAEGSKQSMFPREALILSAIRTMAKELGVICDPGIISTPEFRAVFVEHHLRKVNEAAAAFAEKHGIKQ
jgi:hypothetical protein